MKNNEYWVKFYKKTEVSLRETSFAKFVVKYLNRNKIKSRKIIDLACGNGRDSIFFQKNDFLVTAIDMSIDLKLKNINFQKANILEYDISGFELIYLRFVIHTITEKELDSLIEKLSNQNSLIFIETRSSKGVTNENSSETFFKSKIGEEHFRMLYSEEYLSKKLSEKFKIIYKSEKNGFSKFKGEDPICIRYILKNKQKNEIK